MTDPGIERFRESNAGLSKLVQDELAGFFGALDLSKPEASRDALLEFTPLLVEQYGAVAESLALDWYDEQRAASGAVGSFRAAAPNLGIPKEAVESKVRYLAGTLWTPEPEDMLGALSTSVDKYVKQPARAVIPWNARREGARWARVPTGAKTCSFCLVLASRDAAYLSKRSAKYDQKTGEKYHGDCDCQPVRIGAGDEYPDGYLPAALYDVYDISADKTDTRQNIRAIVYDIRRRFPDAVRDGVIDPEYLERVG